MFIYEGNYKLLVAVNKAWDNICMKPSKHLVNPWAGSVKYSVCCLLSLECHPLTQLNLELRSAWELGIKQRMQML